MQCLPVPAGVARWSRRRRIPETFFTVWTNVFERGRLQAGESILVHGGSSGIGTTAIQLARAFGARVFATAGSAAKCEACVRLGAEIAVNYREQDWGAALREATGGRGVDVILDMVGGDYVARNLTLLARRGPPGADCVPQASSKVELDLMQVMRRRLTITGSTLRPRTPAEKGAIAAALEAQVWPLLAAGTVRPVIHATFPLARAADAHRMMEASEHIGKIVLEVRDDANADQLGLDVRTRHRLLTRRRPGRLGIRVGHDRLRLRGDDHRRRASRRRPSSA